MKQTITSMLSSRDGRISYTTDLRRRNNYVLMTLKSSPLMIPSAGRRVNTAAGRLIDPPFDLLINDEPMSSGSQPSSEGAHGEKRLSSLDWREMACRRFRFRHFCRSCYVISHVLRLRSRDRTRRLSKCHS